MSDRLLVADGHGGVDELEDVESMERHPSLDEVCIHFADGSLDYYRTEDVYDVAPGVQEVA